jgi:hypothetical protein
MKNIETIEGVVWKDCPSDASLLVQRTHELRKKNVDDFDVEDFRLMIGQAEALSILVPNAISILRNDILAEGDYYPGDLLNSVLSINKDFWDHHPSLREQVCMIINSDFQKIIDENNMLLATEAREFLKG